MPDLTPQSIRQAERLVHAVRCAHASIDAARCRFIYDLRGIEPSIRARSPLHSRLERLAFRGSLGKALRDLKAEATADPIESAE